VAEWVARQTGPSPLLVRSATPGWRAPPGAREIRTAACPRLELPTATVTGEPSKEFVRQLRRFTRRLERKGVRLEWVPAGGVDEALLAALFELKPEAFDEPRRRLHRRLCERAGPGRGPAAVVARRDDRVVGVLYGFWWRDSFAGYQHAWDRDYARDALGNVLVLHAIEHATAAGARSFDFLRGSEPYKYRFGAHDEWDRTWLVPRGPGGALLAAAASARRAARPAAEPRPAG
jgi:CelD/BcsL family acetyltransferase involved in cellulose biosynthesis